MKEGMKEEQESAFTIIIEENLKGNPLSPWNIKWKKQQLVLKLKDYRKMMISVEPIKD